MLQSFEYGLVCMKFAGFTLDGGEDGCECPVLLAERFMESLMGSRDSARVTDASGAPKTNRTSDLPLRRGLLYPLSYRG